MQEKFETAAAPRAYDLDRERSASMAFEGGAAAAEMERQEELEWGSRHALPSTKLAKWREPRSGWGKTLLIGALAIGAAALLTRLALRWTRR